MQNNFFIKNKNQKVVTKLFYRQILYVNFKFLVTKWCDRRTALSKNRSYELS